jgi:hypothetical protein
MVRAYVKGDTVTSAVIVNPRIKPDRQKTADLSREYAESEGETIEIFTGKASATSFSMKAAIRF